MPTAAWVIYDIILGVVGFWFLERTLTSNEKRVVALLVIVGIAVATYSGYSDHQDSERMATSENKVMQLSEGQAFKRQA